MHTRLPSLKHLDRATLTLVSGKHDDGALSRVAVTRHVVDTTVFLVKPLVLGDARLCESWCLVITHVAVLNTRKGKQMDRSQHTEKLMGANQDRASWSVWPEELRTSGGADVPAVVALRAPLRQTQLPCKEPNGQFGLRINV